MLTDAIIGERVRVVVPRGYSAVSGRAGVVTEAGSRWVVVHLDGDDEEDPYRVAVWHLERAVTPQASVELKEGE